MTQEGSQSVAMVVHGQERRESPRQIRVTHILRLDGDPVWGKLVILCCREKPLASCAPPVPQTDSGGQVENTKVIERTVVKELGKMPP